MTFDPIAGAADPPMMPREEILLRCDLNLAAYLRHTIGHAREGTFEDEDGVLLFAGSHPNPLPYINGVLRVDLTTPGHTVLERAERFFGPLRRGYGIWIRDHADADLEEAARESGFWLRPPEEGQPGIFIDHVPVLERAPSAEIQRITDESAARDYLAVIADAWGLPGAPIDLVSAMFLTPEAILTPQVAAFVAYVDGTPAAGSMTFVAHEVAGLFWGARATAARGRGIGLACAVACIEAGLSMGARFGAAQSSLRGTPLWLSAGFQVVTNYRRYIAPPPTART